MSKDKPSALLTQSYRDLLDGNVEYSPESSRGRSTRSRLRDRLKIGIQDFTYLADPDRFDDHEVTLLLDDETERTVLLDGLKEMIAFAYRMQPNDAFESIVEDGVTRGVRRFSPDYGVDEVSIQIRKRGHILEEARQRMDANEPLTDRQIRALLQEGGLPSDELQEYVQSHPAPDDVSYRRRFRGP